MKKTLTKFLALLGVFMFLGAGSAHAADYYLIGNFNQWNMSNTDFGMELNSGASFTEYMYHFDRLNSGDEFKINPSGNTNGNNYIGLSENGADATSVQQKVKWGNGGGYNIKIPRDLKDVTIYFRMYGGYENEWVYISGTSSDNGNVTYWLNGEFISSGSWFSPRLTQSATESNIWKYTFKSLGNGSGKFGVREETNGNQSNYYKGGSPLKEEDPSQQLNTGGSDATFVLTRGKEYTFVWDSDSKTISLLGYEKTSYPENLYIYGHINNKAWEFDNYEVLISPNNDGKYYIEDVNISGIWNIYDQKFDPSQVSGTHTKGKNFIAFFPKEITEQDGREVFGSADLKYGAAVDNKLVDTDESTNELKRSSYNFMVAEGFYDIEVDLVNGTVKFKKKSYNADSEKYDVEFNWHDGDGTEIDYDGNNHTMKLGENNIIQVGIEGRDDHWVATCSKFEVRMYVGQSSANKNPAKRYVSGDVDEEGYALATRGADYLLLDDDNNETEHHEEDVNNKIQLLQVGDYKITASLPEEATPSSYYSVAPVVMYATVNADATAITKNQKITFVYEGKTEIEDAVAFDYELKSTDYEVKIEKTGNDWNDITELYTDQTAGLKAQYDRVKDAGYNIDGLYTDITDAELTYNEDASNTSDNTFSYTFSATIPSSGSYLVTISPSTSNTSYEFETATFELDVYPNLDYTFTSLEETAFKVDDFNVTQIGDKETVKWPYYTNAQGQRELYLGGQGTLSKVSCYTPGIYGAEPNALVISGGSWTSTPGTSDNASSINPPRLVKRNVAEDPYENIYWGGFADFSAITGEGNLSGVQAVVTKNGLSSEPLTFSINVNTSNSTTGVDAIGAEEDGEAVYYNLQGVKVENPEKGLYIKVVGDKATKVVL